ncbi:hypothetical protein ABZ511_06140 [Nocardia gamkensis]|uniref:hypothetical protein n=1 Tax=Nocardia gamkensis TaxID=352869 RepID=UPI0033CB5C3E
MLDATRQAVAALDAVSVFGPPEARTRGLVDAFEAVAQLRSGLLRRYRLMDGALLPSRSPAQSYFRIRTAEMPGSRVLSHAVDVIARCLADMCDAPIAGSDMVREIAAIRRFLCDTSAAAVPAVIVEEDGPRQDADDIRSAHSSVEQTWFDRWIIGHQLHALLNVCAAIALGEAIRDVHAGGADSAIGNLEAATIYVGGFTAARAHTLALPAHFYGAVLRPTMTPPFVSLPLSGSMHLEYRAFRSRMAEMLRVLPEPIADLSSREPRLALARESVLEADLADSLRHITLVEPIVGNGKSLVQGPRTKDNAISMLGKIHDRRSAEFAKYLRSGGAGDEVTP